METKLCECGCEIEFPKYDNRGRERRFIPGHSRKTVPVPGVKISSQGYGMMKAPEHPRADNHGYVPIQVLRAEMALGKFLPPKVVVHHVDGDKLNNMPDNLVICENSGYHNLLHKRTKAYKECSHANWLKCPYCGKYDDPKNLRVFGNGSTKGHHKECSAKYSLERYHNIKEKEGLIHNQRTKTVSKEELL